MSVSQNRKYMNTGTVTINIVSATNWNPYSVNVTYPSSFSNPVEGVFLTINNMKADNFLNVSFYGIVNSFTQTAFTLYVYSNTTSVIRSLGYRYMVIALKDTNTYGWILRTVVQEINRTNIYIDYSSCHSFAINVSLGGAYSLSFSTLNQYAISFLGYDISATNTNS